MQTLSSCFAFSLKSDYCKAVRLPRFRSISWSRSCLDDSSDLKPCIWGAREAGLVFLGSDQGEDDFCLAELPRELKNIPDQGEIAAEELECKLLLV